MQTNCPFCLQNANILSFQVILKRSSCFSVSYLCDMKKKRLTLPTQDMNHIRTKRSDVTIWITAPRGFVNEASEQTKYLQSTIIKLNLSCGCIYRSCVD